MRAARNAFLGQGLRVLFERYRAVENGRRNRGATWQWYTALLRGSPPEGVSREFWSSTRTARVVLISTVAIIPSGVVAMSIAVLLDTKWTFAIMEDFGFLLSALALLLCVSMVAQIPRLTKNRFQRYVSRHDWRICSSCGYSLNGLPDQHLCPECGSGYDYVELVQYWKCMFDGAEKNSHRKNMC